MIEQISPSVYSEPQSPARPSVSEPAGEESRNSFEETSLSRKVLEHLPLPVIAVDGDGRVTLANRRARTLTGGISDGRMLFEFFPDQVTGRVSVAVATRTAKTIRDCAIGDSRFIVDCVPISEEGGGAGGVLMLIPV